MTPEKELYRVSTPSGGKYIVTGARLDSARRRGSGWFGLYFVVGRKDGECEESAYSLPLGMSDISLYSEPVPETEPVGCATVEKPPDKPDDHFDGSFDVAGY